MEILTRLFGVGSEFGKEVWAGDIKLGVTDI